MYFTTENNPHVIRALGVYVVAIALLTVILQFV